MRIILIIIISFFILNCKSKDNSNVYEGEMVGSSYKGDPISYFDFDKVEYYFKDIDSNELRLERGTTDSIDQYLKIVESHYPISIKYGTQFQKELIQYGYSKYTLKNSLHPKIDSIFSKKPCNDWSADACIPEYRDIFIFFKEDKIIGIGKICFGCKLHHILGEKVSSGNFGQCGDFEKLEELVKNQNNLISE